MRNEKGQFVKGNSPLNHKQNCNCFRCNPQAGENSKFWKGKNIGYSGIHMRKRKDNPASSYSCRMKDDTCKGQMCWASISHKALPDSHDYIPLCNSHNQRYDQEVILKRNNLSKRNKSGTRGVFYHEKNKRWIAYVQLNGKRKHLGTFKNELDAIVARKEAILKAFPSMV